MIELVLSPEHKNYHARKAKRSSHISFDIWKYIVFWLLYILHVYHTTFRQASMNTIDLNSQIIVIYLLFHTKARIHRMTTWGLWTSWILAVTASMWVLEGCKTQISNNYTDNVNEVMSDVPPEDGNIFLSTCATNINFLQHQILSKLQFALTQEQWKRQDSNTNIHRNISVML